MTSRKQQAWEEGSEQMAGLRRGISSPVFYSAVLACGLVGLYYGLELAGPRIERWVEQWRLQRLVRSADPRSRLEAVLAMETKDPTLTTPYLIEAVRDSDVAVQLTACRILATRANHVPLLISVLTRTASHPVDRVRADSAVILGRLAAGSTSKSPTTEASPTAPDTGTTTEITEILCRLLKDRGSEVRTAAAEALGARGLGPAPPELVAAAADPDRSVRLAVAGSLLRRNGPDDPAVRRLLCALIADPGPIADRFKILRMVQETGSETQDQAVQALAGLLPHVDPAVLPDVIACLGESRNTTSAAVPILNKLLDNPEPSTRASAALAILAIDEKPTPRVLAVLLEMIASKDLAQDLRMDALGRIREADPKALAGTTPALIRQLGDKSPDIRRAAIELLMAIVEDTPAEMPKATEGK